MLPTFWFHNIVMEFRENFTKFNDFIFTKFLNVVLQLPHSTVLNMNNCAKYTVVVKKGKAITSIFSLLICCIFKNLQRLYGQCRLCFSDEQLGKLPNQTFIYFVWEQIRSVLLYRSLFFVCFFNEVFMSRYQPVVCAVGTAYCTAPEFIFIKHSWICSMLICLIGQFCGPGATRSCYWVRLITLYRCRFLPIKIFIDHCVAPVELHNKTNPRLCMNWSILTSLADPPFPHNLKIPGSKPLQLFISTSCSGTWKEEFSLMLKGVKYISVSSYWLMVFCC